MGPTDLKVGCCGFPGGMRSYFEEFSLAEVQTTFYNLPRAETAMGWRERAPRGFEFSVKAWQGLTHPPNMPTWRRTKVKVPVERAERYGFLRPTEEVFEAWEQTREICKALAAKICLIQCPERFEVTEKNLANMREFFISIERGGLSIAWEPRGPSWSDGVVEKLCRELDLIHCVEPFARPIPRFRRVVYLRLHGKPPGDKLYIYRYSDEDLRRLSNMISKLDDATEVYCLFNNMSMREDAKRLISNMAE